MNYTAIFDAGIDESDCLLWSIVNHGEDKCEFFRLINEWSNIDFLFKYFDKHKKLLETDFWIRNGITSVELAVRRVYAEIRSFKNELIWLNKNGLITDSDEINKIFKNLHKNQFYVGKSTDMEQVKAKPDIHAPILRFYGLRLEKNQILITGGGIKLTETIQEMPELEDEIKKTILVDAILKEEKIYFLP